MRRTVLCNNKSKGGLDMINLHDFQRSFLINWAIKLLREGNDEWKILPIYFLSKVGGCHVFKSKIEKKQFKGFDEIKSIFWRKVLEAWIDSNKREDEISSYDPIHNNHQFTVNNNTIFNQECIKNNIICIKDLVRDGAMISFNNYENMIGRRANNIIEFLTLKTALSKIKNKISKDIKEDKYTFLGINVNLLNRKRVYNLMKKDEICQCENFWEKKLNRQLNENTWKNIFEDSKETKLQELQWKIVHNIFPTNIILNRMQIKDSERCEYCGEKDFIEHLFYNCTRIGLFWQVIANLASNKIGKKIILNETTVLLGIEQDSNYNDLTIDERRFINETLMIGKLSIVKSRALGNDLLSTFEKERKLRGKLLNEL